MPNPILAPEIRYAVQLVREVADALLQVSDCGAAARCIPAPPARQQQADGRRSKASPTGPATFSMDADPEALIGSARDRCPTPCRTVRRKARWNHRSEHRQAGCMRPMMVSAVRCKDSVIQSLVRWPPTGGLVVRGIHKPDGPFRPGRGRDWIALSLPRRIHQACGGPEFSSRPRSPACAAGAGRRTS